MKQIFTSSLLVAGAALAIAATAMANDDKTYTFKRPNGTDHVHRYNTTLYTHNSHEVQTLRGDAILTTKKPIGKIAVSPAGTSCIVINNEKKGTSAGLYDLTRTDWKMAGINVKKLGRPTAACYTPDARLVLVACGETLQILDARELKPVSSMPLAFEPTDIMMSQNGYFLAATDGHRAAVYNFEDHSLRKEWNEEEAINALAFNDDSSDFAILQADGLLNIYDTRNFRVRKTIDDLGEGLACAFHADGKYIAVAVNPNTAVVVNLLRDKEREYVVAEEGGISDLTFMTDYRRSTLLAYNTLKNVNVKRLTSLEPAYSRLLNDRVDDELNEWLKMMPGESMEEYSARVNDETRAKRRRLIEDEISTEFAGNLAEMAKISLGSYDRASGRLALEFDNMPTIALDVPEADLASFEDPELLEIQDARYGLLNDDTFELIYARFHNKSDGKDFVYDNTERKALDFIAADADMVSLDVIRQQQMEEIKLQEIKKKVVEEAMSRNVISDRTNITVDSRVVPDYNANGDKILNYQVKFTYDVDPEFSASEDFAPGKYHAEESGAASSMLAIVKQAFEGDFAQYLEEGKKCRIKISGTADASPVLRTIAYDGRYGDFDQEPVYQNDLLSGISVSKKGGINENEQLAFLRAVSVRNYLHSNVDKLAQMQTDTRYHINVSEEKGSAHRRITAEFTFVDVFEQ